MPSCYHHYHAQYCAVSRAFRLLAGVLASLLNHFVVPLANLDSTLMPIHSTIDAMSDAIDGASVMLYGVSLQYKESANVRGALTVASSRCR